MTTQAQITANRSNAQKSTGPRTPEGKARVARNAVRHGLLAKDAVVVGEELEEFDLYRAELRADLAPVGMVESLLTERIAGLFWRLRRAERLHTEAFDVLYAQCAADPLNKRKWPAQAPEAADPFVGVTVVKDFSETQVLERLLGYERRIESSLCRMMGKLESLRKGPGAGAQGPGAEPACQTKPIGQDEAWGTAGVGLASQAAPLQALALGEPVVRTKPIGSGLGQERGALPVSEEHGRDARATETPDGVTTNAVEPVRQTKPIGRDEAWGTGGVGLYPQPSPLQALALGEPVVQTKPIGSGSGQERGALPVSEEHGRDAHATETPDGVTTNAVEPVRQTKPIGRDEAWGTGGVGLYPQPSPLQALALGEPVVQTKPIGSGSGQERGALPVSEEHGRDAHATETPDGVTTNAVEPVRQTKPIGRDEAWGTGGVGLYPQPSPLQALALGEPVVQTKPIGSGSGQERGALPVSEEHGRDAHATETPDGVTTNAVEPVRQTKPIGRDEAWGTGGVGLYPQPSPLQALAFGEPVVQTKPIGSGSGQEHGALPVSEEHGRDAHATETPDGVTTNAEKAREQPGETRRPRQKSPTRASTRVSE